MALVVKKSRIARSNANYVAPMDQIITVEVPVKSIYDKLLNTFPEDYIHRHLLTDAIIGTAINNGTVSYIYNALQGFEPDINFEVGQRVETTSGHYTYVDAGNAAWKQQHQEIGAATILAIDPYSDKKLLIEYPSRNYNGKETTATSWVDHKTCTKASQEVVAMVAELS